MLSNRNPFPAIRTALIERTLLRLCFVFTVNLMVWAIFAVRVLLERLIVLMILTRPIPFSCVLLSYFAKVTFASADVQLSPIDVVRAATAGNGSRFECFENQYEMPLVFWHKTSLEPKLSMLRSLGAQNVIFKRAGKLAV